MVSITRALRQIKDDLATYLSAAFVESICREVGHHWRDRVLDPVTTIHLFILQILHGNTACSHLRHLASEAFSAAAYCQARSRLPLEVIKTLVSRIGARMQQAAAHTGLWMGHRTILIDGSSFSMPETVTVRELRYRIEAPGYRPGEITLVTTLLNAETYTAEDLAELYQARWEVETNLRHLKTTLGMDILHCKTVDGILKEMWMFALVYNLVRLVMLETARQREVEPARVSFIDAARWLALAAGNADTACVVHLASLIINPARAHRVEPRVIKRRLKEFLLMKKPRDQLRQDLGRGNLVA